VLTGSKFYLGVGVINLFGDICILTVPVSSVMKLKLARTQKIAISLIFLLGSLYVLSLSTGLDAKTLFSFRSRKIYKTC
jgi:hypothetical protein